MVNLVTERLKKLTTLVTKGTIPFLIFGASVAGIMVSELLLRAMLLMLN